MTCTTCHDPHGARKIDYKAVCQSCHPSAHNAKQDCTNCHMPKRRTDDVVHVVMTDHFIQRRKPARNLLAPLKEQPETEATAYRGEVAPYYPPAATDELYLAVAQVTERSNLKAGIPRLESAISKQKPAEARFYFELAEAYWKSGETAKALPWYEEALRRKPDDRASLRNYGAALRRHGDLSKAASVLERAGDDAAALTTLGDVYLSLGRVDDAERVLRRAAAIDPDSPEANNNLGQALARKGDPDSAINALRNAIRVRPDYAAAHNSLANLLADFGEARRHFELAIRFDPLYAEAHYNYGTALAQRKQWREAERHLIEAARIQPSFAEAYNNLGNVYAAQGADAKAAAAFAQAVQARPDFGEARLNLAVALANTGRISQAKEELTKAAQSADPQVRERALHGLEALGR
jgi:tetratricopeptide (TPR) repeat protein